MFVTSDHLRKVGLELLQAAGVGLQEAGLVAENLVAAELRGVPTHGINLLRQRFRTDGGRRGHAPLH